MPDREKEQKERAQQLRSQIRRSKSSRGIPGDDYQEKRPDESPKEYVERLEQRMRDQQAKKQDSSGGR